MSLQRLATCGVGSWPKRWRLLCTATRGLRLGVDAGIGGRPPTLGGGRAQNVMGLTGASHRGMPPVPWMMSRSGALPQL